MEALMSTVMVATSIVSLVCWIMVLVKIFKESVGLGILGIICGIFTFIYGWVKVQEYNCKKVMLVWSAAIILSVLASMFGGAIIFNQIMGATQQSTETPAAYE